MEVMPPDLDDDAIRRYLLGLLPEPEAEALEEAYFGHPETLERVRGVEDDLLDDYAAGRLTTTDKLLFEGRYLGRPALRERVIAARALRLATAETSRPATQVSAAGNQSRWRGLLALAAGLVIAVAVYSIWPTRRARVTMASPPPVSVVASPGTPTPEPTGTVSIPAPPRPAGPHGSPLTGRLVLALSPVLLRGEGETSAIRIPSDTGTVILELQGDPASLPSTVQRLDIVISTVEGRRAWIGAARRLTDRGRPNVLASAAVPAHRLVPADYLVTLSSAGETIHRYFLRVAER
jgi:hypothetical protein